MILTDANYQILTLLRSHRDDAKGLATMAAHAYPIHSIRLRAELAPEQLAAALSAVDEKATLRGMTAHFLKLLLLHPTTPPDMPEGDLSEIMRTMQFESQAIAFSTSCVYCKTTKDVLAGTRTWTLQYGN